jgi:hypothetical protein
VAGEVWAWNGWRLCGLRENLRGINGIKGIAMVAKVTQNFDLSTLYNQLLDVILTEHAQHVRDSSDCA